ncbi:MAG TPA: hypothetical protein DCX03_03195 [Bacteroidales bacterium]|nr:MAG: Uncharacterized protein XD85_0054 [Parcubacteria bacterium 34_609]HAW58015.1 hypothetical protein [Bacteroidales bacterium]
MKKTSVFIQQDSKWQALEAYILRIESYSDTSPGLVIENCKSLIESIFKTIIVEVERKTADDLKDDDIGNLNKQVRKILQLEERGYAQIIGSFSSAIAQFRNSLGETSHGKDIYTLEDNRSALFEDEINFLLATTDNIAFFLLSYYKNLYPAFAEKLKKLVYEDNAEFNDWFDENEPAVSVRDVELSPSRVLFDNDEEAYKAYLLDYQEKDSLIEELRISPNFASTHQIIAKLSAGQNFSDPQIKRIWEAFMQNNQVHWIATDHDVESFCKPIIFDNRELFTDDEISQFVTYYNE